MDLVLVLHLSEEWNPIPQLRWREEMKRFHGGLLGLEWWRVRYPGESTQARRAGLCCFP